MDEYTGVSKCDDGSFCCGHGNSTCCSGKTGIYLNKDGMQIILRPDQGSSDESQTRASSTETRESAPVTLETQTRAPVPTSSISSTSTGMAAATSVPSNSEKRDGHGLSQDAKVGIGVPAVVIALLAWCFPRQRKAIIGR